MGVSISDDIIRRDLASISRGSIRIPLAFQSASGSVLKDYEGKTYTDLTAGWNVTNAGWNTPAIINAVKKQFGKTAYCPNWCTNNERVELAEKLNRLLNDEYRTICCVTGSEAVEMALKVARRATGRFHVTGFENSYHGCTLGAMLAGGFKSLHDKDVPNNYHAHLPLPDNKKITENYGAELKHAIKNGAPPAALLMETIFTNPGILYSGTPFYKELYNAVKRAGGLFIADEVATGFGRAGKMFAFQHFDIQPDIVVLGKAITSGVMPLAAVLIKKELHTFVKGMGFHSTYAFTPAACSAAIANIDYMESKQLVARSAELGDECIKYLSKRLLGCKYVFEVRGKGLSIGIELVNSQKDVVDYGMLNKMFFELMDEGVFVERSAYTSTVLIMPPLTIPRKLLFEALDKIIYKILKYNFDAKA